MVGRGWYGLGLVALAGCWPASPPGGVHPVAGYRLDRPRAALASFQPSPGVRVDSLEVSGTWTAPAVPDLGQYGPIQGWRVCALGGATLPPPVTGEPSGAKCLDLPGTATAALVRLPWAPGGLGPAGATDTWSVRMCVQSVRHGVTGPNVCQDASFNVTYPAPPGAFNLSVTVTVRGFPE